MKHISTQKQTDSYQAHCVHLPPTYEMCVCFSDISKKKKKERSFGARSITHTVIAMDVWGILAHCTK